MNETAATSQTRTATRRQENLFFNRYYSRLKDYYSFHVRNSTLAHELTIAALGKVMTKLDEYDATKPMDNWVVRIARNHLVDYYRRRASQKNKLVTYENQALTEEDTEDVYYQAVGQDEREQEFELLLADSMRVLAEWPGVQGRAIRLGLLENVDKRLISKETGLSETQIKNLLTQARTRLRKKLEEV